jgi:ABC-type transport system substrate-binding protein
MAYLDDLSSLDPALAYDPSASPLINALFDGLVGYGLGTEIVPRAAERWEISPDGTRYVFFLRRDVRFHNGRACTAADFKYSIERVLNIPLVTGNRFLISSPGAAFFAEIAGAREVIEGRAREASGIRARDPWTLEIELTAPQSFFLNILTLGFGAAVPREEVERWGEDFTLHPIGTGAFRFVAWLRGQRVVLERNPDYFIAGVPRVDRFVGEIGYSGQMQAMKFERGELDYVNLTDAPPAVYARLAGDPRWSGRVVGAPLANTWYVVMNCETPPFDDARVRRAVCYAIDRDHLIRVNNNRGIPARGIIPPGLVGYDPALEGYAHDPERARALLREAGYPDGLEARLLTPTLPLFVRLAESIQYDLAEAGIRVELQQLAIASYLDAIYRRGGSTLALTSWTIDYPDPDNFLYSNFSTRSIAETGSMNAAFYSNPALDELLERGRALAAGPEREALYRRAGRIVVDDAPAAYLFHEVRYVVGADGLVDYAPHPVYSIDLRAVGWGP